MRIRTLLLVSFCLFSGLAVLRAQESNDSRRYSFGARVQFIESNLFSTTTVTSSTTKPAADYKYYSGGGASRFEGGPTFEMRIWNRLSLGLEMMYHPVRYNQVLEVRTGVAPSGTDTRTPSTYTETTRADYWDFPLVARYRGVRSSGFLSHVYPLGGVAFRHTGNIRTANETSRADGTTAYNEIPAGPAHRNEFGAVMGVGLRFADPLGLKIMPEVRFTKWQSPVFQGTSYHSTTNQLEAGLGCNF